MIAQIGRFNAMAVALLTLVLIFMVWQSGHARPQINLTLVVQKPATEQQQQQQPQQQADNAKNSTRTDGPIDGQTFYGDLPPPGDDGDDDDSSDSGNDIGLVMPEEAYSI